MPVYHKNLMNVCRFLKVQTFIKKCIALTNDTGYNRQKMEMMLFVKGFNFQKQFISRAELMELGLSHYQIKRLVEQGILSGINRRYYENLSYEGELNDFYAVTAYTGQGVVCMMSAAVYYGLTTYRPFQIDVAIPREARLPTSPDWPVMHFYRFSKERYGIGVDVIREEENDFRIYDMEKTICDIVFYRNKLGFEIAVEVVKRYVNQERRDLNRLMAYAKKLHVENTIRQYLEVML